MMIRLVPRPSMISCFITRTRSFSRLTQNLLPGEGKFSNTFGIRLTVRSISVSATSSPPSPVLSEKQVDQVDNVLAAKEDEHGGVIVEMSTDPMDPIMFTSLLKASILHWKQQGKRGVWIKLPIELVNLIEPVVKEGFYYHHAEPRHLMLVHWIPETTNTLPANASHRVGIGAFVMNENGEVLVVQEKSGKFQGTGIWKFPTGVVDEGEDICNAAVREVKEETGIDTKFVEVLAFRQSHKSFFDKSDLFFMCMLQPLSFNIQKQEREIEAAQWMSFEEYAGQPFVQKHDLLRYIVKVCIAKRNEKYSGFSPVPTITSFSNKPSNLYLNSKDLDY
ncbi:nudix hydrolase 2-like [Cynara cardunculus var. scolymus]|uniref:Nudix hydrolase 6-like protein n=1 Tax=Cynara cardunculus var. scolymus TaxID=59895 RepID=A0A118K0C3_CYNCS|nr:nudix hydrolase 2-like [Cynara cardunculus var. scolymus]KVI01127.1 Nudix hydrolase 6-like protein [Cynara cardunculus var. scolymus]